ncbi:hypothetical protein [Aneurinibacillus tyrosinisolvens]|uniref:hypothetical protein n=1 Tax=Aneurinibacillus tyrosinisolvens TaxID=1443435 RepID=UPI00063F008A|nr:hypothetical protein [Aneurinibacillus tyrosinisolvens]
MNSKRRSLIGIRTKLLSDEVYRILNSKSKGVNDLPIYINRLVEDDLFRVRREEREDQLLALVREMHKELKVLRTEVMLRSVVPVSAQRTMAVEVKAMKEENFTEGQLVYEEEVTGKIEEKINLDL